MEQMLQYPANIHTHSMWSFLQHLITTFEGRKYAITNHLIVLNISGMPIDYIGEK